MLTCTVECSYLEALGSTSRKRQLYYSVMYHKTLYLILVVNFKIVLNIATRYLYVVTFLPLMTLFWMLNCQMMNLLGPSIPVKMYTWLSKYYFPLLDHLPLAVWSQTEFLTIVAMGGLVRDMSLLSDLLSDKYFQVEQLNKFKLINSFLT